MSNYRRYGIEEDPSEMYTSGYLQQMYDRMDKDISWMSDRVENVMSTLVREREAKGDELKIAIYKIKYPKDRGHDTFTGYYMPAPSGISDREGFIPAAAVRARVDITHPKNQPNTRHVFTIARKPVITYNPDTDSYPYIHETMLVNPTRQEVKLPLGSIRDIWSSRAEKQHGECSDYKRKHEKYYLETLNNEIEKGASGYHYPDQEFYTGGRGQWASLLTQGLLGYLISTPPYEANVDVVEWSQYRYRAWYSNT
ncbi:MAG: hypothetical protein WAV40_01615 [Microgenomates group bacterium]